MKQNVIILMIISSVFTACSSSEFEIKESEVPQNVVTALKGKYPNAQVSKWFAEKEDDKFYFEAEIKDGNKEKEIHITSDGASVTEEE